MLFWLAVILNAALFFNCLRLYYHGSVDVLASSCDTGWIIRTGDYILKTGAVPVHDIFTWTISGQPFVAYQWLFELMSALVFRVGGLWLVGLVAYALSGVLYLVVMPAIWQRMRVPSLLAYAAMSLVLTPWWFNARPQLVSYYFILLMIFCLEKAKGNSESKWLFVIPLMMLCWASIHSFWSIGLIILAVYTLTAVCKKRAEWKRLLIVMALSLGAILINPYGLELVKHVSSFAGNEQWMGVWEVQPSVTSPDFKYFLAYLCLMWFVSFKFRKSLAIEHLCLLAISSVAALSIRRYESIAVLMSWPYFAMALRQHPQIEQFMRTMDGDEDRVKENLVKEILLGKWFTTAPRIFVAAAVCVLISCGIWRYNYPTEASVRIIFCNYGLESLHFFAQNLTGKQDFFSDPVTGSWLLLLGVERVFIDTRYDIYPKQFCQDAILCVAGAPGWDEFLKKNGIRFIALRNLAAGLTRNLQSSQNWYTLLDDGVVTIYVRMDAHTNELLERLKLRDSDLASSTFNSRTIERTVADRRTHEGPH